MDTTTEVTMTCRGRRVTGTFSHPFEAVGPLGRARLHAMAAALDQDQQQQIAAILAKAHAEGPTPEVMEMIRRAVESGRDREAPPVVQCSAT